MPNCEAIVPTPPLFSSSCHIVLHLFESDYSKELSFQKHTVYVSPKINMLLFPAWKPWGMRPWVCLFTLFPSQ